MARNVAGNAASSASGNEATTRQIAGVAQSAATAVSVDIYDQVYHLRGTDPKHIEKLASLVDSKMRAVAAHGSTVDSLRVAVLASLNIADELLALRARFDAMAGNAGTAETAMRSRAGTLSDMLDEVLEQCG